MRVINSPGLTGVTLTGHLPIYSRFTNYMQWFSVNFSKITRPTVTQNQSHNLQSNNLQSNNLCSKTNGGNPIIMAMTPGCKDILREPLHIICKQTVTPMVSRNDY